MRYPSHVAFAAVFAYEVAADGAAAFEAVYGPEGEWARYFHGADGYRGTELLRATGRGGLSYLVIDRWESAAAYERFLAEHEEEYARRNQAAGRLYRQETVIGRFDAICRRRDAASTFGREVRTTRDQQ